MEAYRDVQRYFGTGWTQDRLAVEGPTIFLEENRGSSLTFENILQTTKALAKCLNLQAKSFLYHYLYAPVSV